MNVNERRYADSRDERDRDDAWDDRRAARPRRGPLSRLFGLVKLALFLTPLAFLLYGYVLADCRSGGRGLTSSGGLDQFLQAGICARGEIVGNAASLQENLRLIRRVID